MNIPSPAQCVTRFACAAFALLMPGMGLVCLPLAAQTSQAIYADFLQNGWADWGWAKIDYQNPQPVHGGSRSIGVTFTDNSWQAIYFHHEPFDTTSFTNLVFWIHGGASGGQRVQVQALLDGKAQPAAALAALPANTWQRMTISLASLGAARQPNCSGFWIQDRAGAAQPAFFLDDLALEGAAPAPPATNAPVAIRVDVAANRRPISPYIYSVAFASAEELAALNSPLNRSGGNSETRYNWQLNAHNHANDWYFESLADSPATPGAAADQHVAASLAGGGEAMLTVPMIGWAPKLGPNRGKLASFSVAKYGPQRDTDKQWFPDAGNGLRASDGAPITGNDPRDANVPVDSVFQQQWIQHLANRWGLAAQGGVRYYCMDNEPSLWHSTHRDVHPQGATMREIRDAFFDYAQKVKAIDPDARLCAPEEWGWMGYFWSGADQQWAGARKDYNQNHYPDRQASGGWDYLPWFLDQARQRASSTGQRWLDVLTVHYYPQGGEFSDDTSAEAQRLRNRSTRSLWDPAYTDASWVNSVVKLIPRLREWVANYYPGTQIGLTEYNWGAEKHINGATAQADVLGIFGREQLDFATRWTTPALGTPAFKAIQMYRNYDGHRSAFGDTSVSAATDANADRLAVFAAARSTDGALTVMAINKELDAAVPVTVSVAGHPASSAAQVWQLTSANQIARLSDAVVSGSIFSSSLPPQSITLFVLAAQTAPRLQCEPSGAGGQCRFRLDGQAGQRVVLLASADLAAWVPVQTNTLTGSSLAYTAPASGVARFFKAQLLR